MIKKRKAIIFSAIFLISFYGIYINAAEYILYVMDGEIAAIDLDNKTVVIEIPMGTQFFTIGGPLLPGVRLKKGRKSVGLKSFNVGDSVTVRWRHTGKGHVIEGLFAK